MAEHPKYVYINGHLIGGPKPTNKMKGPDLLNRFVRLRRYAQHQIVGSYEFQQSMYLLIFIERILKKREAAVATSTKHIAKYS